MTDKKNAPEPVAAGRGQEPIPQREETITMQHPINDSVTAWANIAAEVYRDGSRPLEPGDPRRAELTEHARKSRPTFDADAPAEDGSFRWDPSALGRLYVTEVGLEMPAFPAVPKWANAARLEFNGDFGCVDIELASPNYAPDDLIAEDGHPARICFVRTLRVVIDPDHPKFDHAEYEPVVGAVHEVTPVTVYVINADGGFDPLNAHTMANALERCSRAAMDAIAAESK